MAGLAAALAACPIGMIQGQIDFTVFDRDRSGEAQELASRVKRIDDQIADLRRGIDEDIREALLNLDSAAEQVAVARKGRIWRSVNSNSRRIVFSRVRPTTLKWSLPRTNWPAPRRTTSLPFPATWTQSLRSREPWAIRRRTLAVFGESISDLSPGWRYAANHVYANVHAREV
jgi:hypothetical protein